MKLLLLSLALTCKAPELINKSDEPWSAEDKKAIRSATKRCGEIYPESPCLKKFIKKEPRVYMALCGGRE